MCVTPAARGAGIGYELIRRSLDSLLRHGCRKVTLTVTAANTGAIALYERMGFRKTRNFSAYVWGGLSRIGCDNDQEREQRQCGNRAPRLRR